MREYIIPANSKKSQKILGVFHPVDLFIFLPGAGTTLLLLMIFPASNLTAMGLMLLPLLVTSFLVMPVPYYHNVLQFIINVVSFYTNYRRYLWKGWCYKDGSEIK